MSVPGGGSRNKLAKNDLVREYVISMAAHPQSTANSIYRGLQVEFPGIELPSYASIKRFIDKWGAENAETLTRVANPDAWKSNYMVAFGSYSANLERPNQLWELDSTPADLMFEDGRWHLVGCIDVWTRRVQFVVSKTSKAEAIALCLRRCILEWDIPDQIKTDNGKDYASKAIARVTSALGIDQKFCAPFSPQQKPHIERVNRTFQHGLLELLPEYIGSNVAERQAIRNRESFAEQLFKKSGDVGLKGTAAEFAGGFLLNWLEVYNRKTVHSELKMTPFQKASGYRGSIRRVTDERVLDVLLAQAPDQSGLRVVQKDGIHLMNREYIGPELIGYARQKVEVRYDPQDLRHIYVFDPATAELICIASDVEFLSHEHRAEIASTARRQQMANVNSENRKLKAMQKRIIDPQIANQIIAAEAESVRNLISLPNPVIEATGPWIEGAKQVIAALDATPPHLRQLSEAEQAKRDAFIREEAEAEERKRLKAEARAKRRQEMEQHSLQILEDWRNGREPDDLIALADAIDFCLEPVSVGWRLTQFDFDFSAERKFQFWLEIRRKKVA